MGLPSYRKRQLWLAAHKYTYEDRSYCGIRFHVHFKQIKQTLETAGWTWEALGRYIEGYQPKVPPWIRKPPSQPMETITKQQLRLIIAAMYAYTPMERVYTSLGRRVRYYGRGGTPRKGQHYLKPSGKKGTYRVLLAEHDQAKTRRWIVEVFDR